MTDSDDKLKRRYRELAREEPSPALDGAILAKSRARRMSRPGSFRRWSVPLSIAAVLMLGIGISLRMQLEQPGIETSVPATEAPGAVPAAAPGAKPEAARRDEFAPAPPAATAPAEAPRAEKKIVATPARPKLAPQSTTSNVATTPPPPAPAAPPPAALGRVLPDEAKPQTQSVPAAPPAAAFAPALQRAEPAQAPMRAKREAEPERANRASAGVSADASTGARELRKSLAAETDPARELERIAKLRESGQHAEADKALAEFPKRFPDYRIPDAMWQRVRPR